MSIVTPGPATLLVKVGNSASFTGHATVLVMSLTRTCSCLQTNANTADFVCSQWNMHMPYEKSFPKSKHYTGLKMYVHHIANGCIW